jgi:hypothetical protein
MWIKKAVLAALKEAVLTELKAGQANNGLRIDGISKRLDDMNVNLVDQSRRIDVLSGRVESIREELSSRIDRLF